MVEARHIEPKKIDDNFSSHLFDLYLDNLDPERVYFTKADLKSLEKFRVELDDEFSTGKWTFFETSDHLYLQKLKQAENLITTICSKPFDFSTSQVYNPGLDTSRVETDARLMDKWQQVLKIDVLQLLVNSANYQLLTKGKIDRKEILSKEPDFRNKIRSKYLNQIKEIKDDKEYQKTLASLYLNAFLACMDPHSNFMDLTERQNFQSALNTQGYYFGLTLGENEKDEVVIVHVVPGGPAWMSGLLNKDDVLLQLQWENKEPIDLTGLSEPEVSQLLDQYINEKLEMTVRKTNGKKEIVTLQKRQLDNDENTVKSFVLRGEKNIGYISLPSFYTEWEDAEGSKCAEDVAKEIVKLKRDSISGLILDLRYNGGGSLEEAIDMAGIFIDEGAVGQIKTKDPKVAVLKDMNRGMIYSGPLLLLVNGQSASASELLSAALQDYNRALIVGSPTFGKATGQELFPIQHSSSTTVNETNGQGAYVKLTTSRLYRTTGKSLQRVGVQPDIVLPDPYAELEEKESANPFALNGDTVNAYKYFKPLASLPISTLKAKSSDRISSNPKFAQLKNAEASIHNIVHQTNISMKWDDVEKQLEKEFKETGNIMPGQAPMSTLYNPGNNNADAKFISIDDAAKEMNKSWLNRLGKDPYIEESFSILLDLIKINKP
jgi:carboxyl-terminal processing protease